MIGLCAGPQAAHAQTNWTGTASNNWFTVGNWDNGVPAAGVNTTINTITPNATVVNGGAAAAQLLVVGSNATGRLTVQGGGILNNTTGVIGSTLASTGAVTVTGAGSSWVNSSTLFVGDIGSGALAVTNGGRVNNVAGIIANGASSISTVVVDGAGSVWTNTDELHIGGAGTATLTIRNGGTVNNTAGRIGLSAGSNGTVLVTGAGSSWNGVGAFAPFVIGNAGTGSLTIADGATVTNNNGIIAGIALSVGTVTVTGAGSTWTNNLGLTVGNAGMGTLTIENGGRVTNVNNALIGGFSGSQGTVTVTGPGSTWSSGADLRVGNSANAPGFLTITNGGKVSNVAGFIGHGVNAPGTVTVDGPGSTWTSTDELHIGEAGTGTLVIRNGGTVNNTAARVGHLAGSSGTVIVTGAGSSWNGVGAFAPFVIGNAGTGSLVIADGATVTNNNGFIAGIALSAGTVTVTGAGSTWTNNLALVVGNAGNGTLTIENGGRVTNVNNATIGGFTGSQGIATVTGANSTWASGGDMRIGNFANAPGTLTIANGGTVSVAGAGVFLANAANATGTLNIGAATGNAAAAPGALNASLVQFGAGTGTINFNHTAANYAFTPQIAGNGAVNVLAGTTAFNTAMTYTGPTTISGGALSVNGSIASSSLLSVNGGTIGGTGTLPTTQITGGTLAPGNSIGTITVQGNLALSTASTYLVEVALANADRTNVTGTASVAGTVHVVAAGSLAPNTTHTILNAAGGVTGTFSNLTTSFTSAFLTPTLGYDVNNVFLTLQQTASFASVAQTPNQRATAGGVASLGAGNSIFDAVMLSSAPQARQAFDALSGEIHPSAAGVMLDDSRYVRDAVIGRTRQSFGGDSGPLAALGAAMPTLAYADPAHALAYAGKRPAFKAPPAAAIIPNPYALAAWAQAIGGFGRADGDGNAAGLRRNAGGFFSGMDVTIDRMWRFGAAAGYTHSALNVSARSSSAAIDNYHVAVYGGGQFGAWALRGGGAFTAHQLDVSRFAVFPALINALKTDHSARTAQVFGEIGYGFVVGRTAAEPFASVAYVNLDTGGFTETGGAAALTARGQTLEATFTTLGLRAAMVLAMTDWGTVTARATAGWRHAFGDVTPALSLAFASGGSPFTITGVPIAKDSAVIEAGLDFDIRANVRLGLSYSGQLASRAEDHAIKGNLLWRF